jgi:hypothetical protein
MTKELTDLIGQVKNKITDDSDMVWTNYDNAKQLRDELETYILELQSGDMGSIEKLKKFFLPTAPLQEHSISNGWGNEYLELSKKFDGLYAIRRTNI